MKLEKVKKTFGDYEITLSFGQLEAILAALHEKHDDPVGDELLAELSWYLERVPGPGEDEEDEKAKLADGEGDSDADGLAIPLPPGQQAGTPPDDGEEPIEPPSPEGAAGPMAAGPKGAKGTPGQPGPKGAPVGLPDLAAEEGAPEAEPSPEASADTRVPKPPRE